MPRTLERALKLRRQGKHQQALQLLQSLASTHPTDARIQFETASVLDALGMEAQAVPLPVAAMQRGLPGADLRAAYLGPASSYRVLGQYQESKGVLEEGLQKFPQAHEMTVFLAMTLYNLRRHRESVSLLLRVVADTSADGKIREYARAIHSYAENPDRSSKSRPARRNRTARG
jgi:tetratricopeptide (TPR) repeat protein